jgi:hypothetical protein
MRSPELLFVDEVKEGQFYERLRVSPASPRVPLLGLRAIFKLVFGRRVARPTNVRRCGQRSTGERVLATA